MKPRLVVIGNGMAGMRTVEELLKLAPDLYQITVFGAEPHGNYNRILLSPVLAGEMSLDEIMINTEQWYEDNAITLLKGKEVVKIDRLKRVVTAADGTEAPYDRLLLATGSDPIILPVSGVDLPGVVPFRNILDVEAILGATEPGNKAVVIGGGLLGLEAAHGLMKQGMDVTVIHLMETLMERQLDEVAGDMLCASLEKRGLTVIRSAETEAIVGDGRVRAVHLKDGTELAADIVVMAVGIRPNIGLAEAAGLHCQRGIVTGDTMQTYDGRIYAVGECAEHRGRTYGLVAPFFEQAKVCANQLAELGHAAYDGSMTSSKLKVTGIDLFSAGKVVAGDDEETLVIKDAGRGVYKKLILKDNRLRGAVLYGDALDAPWYFQLMRDGTDISNNRDRLLFGQAFLGDSGHGTENVILTMNDNMEVCGCNGVCKGEITDAITEKNLFTLDDVRAHTKASSSCGSCTAMVQQILAFTLGTELSETPSEKPLCKCTEYSHDQVRAAIRENEIKTIAGVMMFLEWQSPDGCPACRPALNYYLLCAWPGDYEDDQQSRFINERVHANIQKDGTFSVVPRMFGGMTTPDELRAIADAADKFNVPSVHVTGGQRIDLLGVKKEVLPDIWRDLGEAGLVSGHAYGKAVRTVKTCVGTEWCRFGTQDSTAMGIAIEKMCWGAWAPHKYKMAVSGCPRNCAEATIKDFGIVAVDSGWELHVGGNGGVKVRATDFLCKVETEDQVLEYTGAFLQLYREEAHYLERTAPWLERVGMAHIRGLVVEDPDNRKALHERFLLAQEFSQDDPWAARAGGKDEHEFNLLKMVG
ncbi:MAG TPA: nitrite reductase large subunit NirB [Rhodospirillales bacterium]|jgi:nitrite reductase (NADH) large subunit|nr:nitrite reductase large subunit NirB [Rhodospirillales bacterium]